MYQPIDLPIRRALLSLTAAAAIADKRIEELRALVECGQLVGFNLAAPGTGRQLARIHTPTLAAYLRGENPPRTETPAAVRAIVGEMLPALSETIRSDTLQRLFSCEHQHVCNLIRLKCFQVVRAGRVGRTGAAIVTKASVIAWLIQRRIV